MALFVSNVALPEGEANPAVAGVLGVPVGRLSSVELLRRSLDARARPPMWRGTFKVELDKGEAEVLARGLPVLHQPERDGVQLMADERVGREVVRGVRDDGD